MAERRNVCVLSYVEAEDLELRNIQPDCGGTHHHVDSEEAWRMVRTVDAAGSASLLSPYFYPIARWCGPWHVEMLRAFAWKMKRSSAMGREDQAATGIAGRLRVTTMQLEERAS